MTSMLSKFIRALDPPVGVRILQLTIVPETEMKRLVAGAIEKAQNDPESLETATVDDVIELIVELLVRRFPNYRRAKIQELLPPDIDIRKTDLWQKAVQEGRQNRLEQIRAEGAARRNVELTRTWLNRGKSLKEIAALFGIPLKDARRLAKDAAK